MSEIDMWDDAGPFVYRNLPESCLSAFFTEERDLLQISKEKDGYWLQDARRPGSSRYDTLSEAKAAGDEEIAEAQCRQDARLLTEAALDKTQWTVSYEDGLRFENASNGLSIVAEIDGVSTSQSWYLFHGDEAIVSDARDVSAVVTAAKEHTT